jgi:putative DNA-invertase from lambdoid prophage Rac
MFIFVWRLDRWGRSLLDLIGSLQELNELGIGFVSLSEALDLTAAKGRAVGRMLAVFAEFERDILRPESLRRAGTANPTDEPPDRAAKRRSDACIRWMLGDGWS